MHVNPDIDLGRSWRRLRRAGTAYRQFVRRIVRKFFRRRRLGRIVYWRRNIRPWIARRIFQRRLGRPPRCRRRRHFLRILHGRFCHVEYLSIGFALRSCAAMRVAKFSSVLITADAPRCSIRMNERWALCGLTQVIRRVAQRQLQARRVFRAGDRDLNFLRCYAGAWHTASMLLPSASSTKAP